MYSPAILKFTDMNIFVYRCAARYGLSALCKVVICKMVAKFHDIDFVDANDLCTEKELVHKPPQKTRVN